MYCLKKRSYIVGLLAALLVCGICGCGSGNTKRKEDARTEVKADAEPEGDEGVVPEEDAVQENDEGAAPEEGAVQKNDEGIASEEETGVTRDDEKNGVSQEEQILALLKNKEELYFTSGGVLATELLGYTEESDVSYFIMKKQSEQGESLYIGSVNPETGELIQCNSYGNTTADAVMAEKDTGIYIVYATECIDFGLHSGYGGVMLAKDGALNPVWPLTTGGAYDDSYWNGYSVKLNGESLEIYKVVVSETGPDGIAISTTTELERTITLEEIVTGAE